MKEKGEQIALEELRGMLKQDVPAYVDVTQPATRISAAEKGGEKNDTSLEISLEQLETIEQKMREVAGPDRSLMISAHNALHRYLKGFYPEIKDGCERAWNSRSRLATLRRILGLWNRSTYSNTSVFAASSVRYFVR